MPTEWRDVSLVEVADEVTVGYVGPMASEYVSAGVPFLRSQNVQPHLIDLSDVRHISQAFHEKIAKSRLAPGDVVTVRTGKPGTTAVIPTELPVANCADLVITRPGPDLDPSWLSYYINGVGSGYVASRLVGAVQQHFNVGSAKEMRLLLPPIDEQRSIAATLGALDNRISSNLRVIQGCMNLATQHFVIATGHADSRRIGDLANVVLGGTPNRSNSHYWHAGSIPWINSGEANKEIILEPTQRITPEGLAKSSAKMMPAGATVVAITGATLGQVALLGIHTAGNQSLVGIWASDERLTLWLHFAIRSATSALLERATGAAQQHVNKGDVEDLEVPVPAQQILDNWFALAKPLVDGAVARARESAACAALRDALLPELLSGRLRVPDAATVA